MKFTVEMTHLDAARFAFLNPIIAVEIGAPNHLRKEDWFWYLVNAFWGTESEATKKFVKHPWAEEMAEACCYNKFVGLSGCASSGKSDFLAIWGIINWIADPEFTKVFFTSTSLKDARKRVWGSVRDYWVNCALPLPGKLIDSQGLIRPDLGPEKKVSERAGLELIAGEQSAEKEAIGKLIGFKQKRVLMMADELSELTPALLEAVYTNMAPGNPDIDGLTLRKQRQCTFGFQMVAASNFNGFVDPFGQFVEPEGSWRDITVEKLKWKTKRGVCLRFDGLKSPNFDQPIDKWPIYGRKHLAEHEKLGRNTRGFWRMCRSFPAPVGAEDVVYTQQELLQGDAFNKRLFSDKPVIRLSSLDPSFTSGGDRSVVHFFTLGTTPEGIRVLVKDETLVLKEDVTVSRPFDRQILDQWQEECERRGVSREQAAFDATGSGISFGTLIDEVWGHGVMGVKFGGAASDRMVRHLDSVKAASEVYLDRVTELWFGGKEFIRSGQIGGIDPALADEMTVRKFDHKKGAETKVFVESKTDMRAEGRKSPDLADAFFIGLELARERFGFVPIGMEGSEYRSSQDGVKDVVMQYDELYSDEWAEWEVGGDE